MALIDRPKIFSRLTGVRAGVTLRGSGSPPYGFNMSYSVGDDQERVRRARERAAATLGFPLERMATQRQVHGDVVGIVERGYRPGESDAIITRERGWLLAVSIADCLPILVYDPEQEAIGGVHSGWRGTALGIATRTIESMKENFSSRPAALRVYMGPSAGGCCYEVGEDVAGRFEERHSREIGGGKYLFDNKGAVLDQLLAAGVTAPNIELDPRCTICGDRFHSYRRDGVRSGRMFALIGLAGEEG